MFPLFPAHTMFTFLFIPSFSSRSEYVIHWIPETFFFFLVHIITFYHSTFPLFPAHSFLTCFQTQSSHRVPSTYISESPRHSFSFTCTMISPCFPFSCVPHFLPPFLYLRYRTHCGGKYRAAQQHGSAAAHYEVSSSKTSWRQHIYCGDGRQSVFSASSDTEQRTTLLYPYPKICMCRLANRFLVDSSERIRGIAILGVIGQILISLLRLGLSESPE